VRGAAYAADGGAAYCFVDARSLAIFTQIYISLCQLSPLTSSVPISHSFRELYQHAAKKTFIFKCIYIYIHFSGQPGHTVRLVSCSPLLLCFSRNYSMSAPYLLADPLFALYSKVFSLDAPPATYYDS